MFTRVQTVELISAVREWDSHCLDCRLCGMWDVEGTIEPCPEGEDLLVRMRIILLRGISSVA